MGKANPFRFSSKYQDDETDLLYYGYRYYDQIHGRWFSRDPRGERGGANLYSFVMNNPLAFLDKLGLFSFACDKCTNGNIRYVHAVDFSLLPLINQGNPNSLDAAEVALGGVESLKKFNAFAEVATGLTAEELAKEVSLAAASAGTSEGMTWGWSDQMVEALKSVEKMYGDQQGVEIAIKVLWQKCEETTWPTWGGGLPLTTHLDWVPHSRWHISSAGVREEGGFDANDSNDIMRAIPFSVIQAIQTEVK